MGVETLTDAHQRALLLLGLLAFGLNTGQRIHRGLLRGFGVMLVIAWLRSFVPQIHVKQALGLAFLEMLR